MDRMKNEYCIIMAGGVGSRFWPLSTQKNPKQFIDILGTGETLIQATFRRFSKFVDPENIYIVTNKAYENLVFKQLPQIVKDQVLLEPAKRNTAPCIAYATCKIMAKDPKATFVVSPSDHLITDEASFEEHIRIALEEVKVNKVLCTLGINPHKPSTSYGYIQYMENGITNPRVKKVKSFTEKPNLEHAQAFLDSGDFLWNSGIFIWGGETIFKAFRDYLPDMYEAFTEGNDLYYTDKEDEFIARIYPTCENQSVDYGILEKAENVYVVPSSFGWNDLGTWGSMYDVKEKGEFGNVDVNGNAILADASGNIVSIPKHKRAVIEGLEDYIIVDSDRSLLIVRKDKEEKIRNIVNDVKVKFGEDFI